MKKPAYFLALLVLLTAIFSSNAQAQAKWSPQAKGAVIGGLGGAAAGAIIHKRNRAVGGIVGGVVGGGVGYAVGKRVDNKNKERARVAAANRAAAYRAAQSRRASLARTSSANNRNQAAPVANSLVPASAAMVAGSTSAANSAFLPNDTHNDSSKPYATSEYRRKSW